MQKPFAITLDVGSSLANKTGAWRSELPVYTELQPPCVSACPAGEQVQQWLYQAEDGGYERAWRQIMADNPFPAVMGRVCYRPCESACNRGQLDEAVGINSVERFLGDEAIKQGWTVPVTAKPTGKHVLVVGAGPAGLSAAYHLTLRGHRVTVRDQGAEAGGMMRYGIPAYRLSRDVLDAEIRRIVDMGVTVELGAEVENAAEAMRGGEFDAVFLAVGAHIGQRIAIPAGDSARILDAVTVLRGMQSDHPPQLGRRVAVYGGGNTALDVARTARRLGATDPIVVYRRTRGRMPAHGFEVDEAIEEGIRVSWLSTVTHADAGSVTIERMELDDSGFPQPTGEFEELAVDALVLAIGQVSDLSLLDGVEGVEVSDGVVVVNRHLMTGHPGVFAGGDMVPSARTATTAIGHGRQAARHIDEWLRGDSHTDEAVPPAATFESLNTWYYSDAPKQHRPRLDAARRTSAFDEVVSGLDERTALFEARRCLSCGNCFECDNCYGVCPDNAIRKLGVGQGYEIDADFCKGCGLCAAECPAGAIVMVPEQA